MKIHSQRNQLFPALSPLLKVVVVILSVLVLGIAQQVSAAGTFSVDGALVSAGDTFNIGVGDSLDFDWTCPAPSGGQAFDQWWFSAGGGATPNNVTGPAGPGASRSGSETVTYNSAGTFYPSVDCGVWGGPGWGNGMWDAGIIDPTPTINVLAVPVQCNDGVDNADPEDTLFDAADPGCWTDPLDSSTYDPNDDDETDPVGAACNWNQIGPGSSGQDPGFCTETPRVQDERDPGYADYVGFECSQWHEGAIADYYQCDNSSPHAWAEVQFECQCSVAPSCEITNIYDSDEAVIEDCTPISMGGNIVSEVCVGMPYEVGDEVTDPADMARNFCWNGQEPGGGGCTWYLAEIDNCPVPPVPSMTVTPLSLDFGDTDISGGPDILTFTVTNTGGGTLVVDANPTITDGGSGFAGNYTCYLGPCGSQQNIAANDSRTYTVRYDPDTISDNQTAQIELTGTFDRAVSLTGNGVSSWCWDREIYSELAGDDPWQVCDNLGGANDCSNFPTCSSIAGFPPNGPADGEPYMGGPDKCVGAAPNGNSGSSAGNWGNPPCSGTPTPSPEAWFSNPNAPIGDPDVTVSVAHNDTLDLTWTSTDANPASCEVRDIGNTITWSGQPNTGTINSGVLTADTSFTVRCENGTGWSPNSPDILADVAAPLPPPTITFTSAPANPIDYDTPATLTWITSGADVCVATQGMAAGFDTLNSINDSDSTVNLTADTIFEIECGNLSASSTALLTVIVGAPPPTLSFDVNNITTGTSYGDGDTLTIDPSDEVEVTWSTTNVDSCLGTSGLPSVTSVGGYNVAEPADGDTTLYTLVCDASDGSTIDAEFTIRTRIANLNVSIIDFTPSAGFDDVLGEYDWVDVEIGVLSNGDIGAPDGELDVTETFTVEVAIDKTGGGTTYDPPESYDINGLDYGDTDYEDVRFFDVPFTNATDPPWFRAQVDTPLPGGSIVESDEDLADNQSETDFSPPLPPLNMTLDIDPSILVRGGSSVEISWDTTATFNMDCSLQGPGLQPDNPHTFNPSVPADGPTGTLTAGPITAKSGYTLTCDVPGVGTPQDYVATSSVETTGTVEEI